MDNLALLRGILGPGVAGAVFGVGWWFWVDAVGSSPRWRHSCSTAWTRMRLDTITTLLTATTPSGGLTNLVATPNLWISVQTIKVADSSEALALCGIAGAVGLLVQDALTDKGPSVWTGVAGVLQCVLVLIRYFFKLTQLVYIYVLWISVDYSDL
uniref:Uncharacterized protein n=1 Tax=Oryza nivara TaxID=4536 RepID=A0A0E0ID63_ORYNI